MSAEPTSIGHRIAVDIRNGAWVPQNQARYLGMFLERGMSQADMVAAQARYADADKTELAAALSLNELVAPSRLELAGRRRRAPWWLALYAFIRWTIPESLVDAFLDDDVTRVITWSLGFFIGVCMGLAIIFGTVHALWRP